MKVLALSDSLAPFHSFWIRIGQYIDSLPWSVHITDDASTINTLREGDRLLMYRFSIRWGDLAARLQQAKQRGVFIISDVDDYIWADISNPSLFRGWSRERLLGYTRALRECHLITCSTESLLLQLSVMFTKQDLQLLPNSSPRMPYLNAVSAPPVRIGWTGAPWTRPNDLAILKPLARWITDRPHELQLVHVGHMDNFPSFAKSLELDHALVETHPLESHKKYLQNLNFHIGLAPLDHTCFNCFKSAIKVIEYSALGIPWLASETSPYQNLCRQWSWSGRLCRDPNDWIEQIQSLLYEKTRRQEGDQLKKLCQQHASYEFGVNRWRTLLSAC